jgi:hypothetical protein
MNFDDKKLSDFIKVYKSVFSRNLCKMMIHDVLDKNEFFNNSGQNYNQNLTKIEFTHDFEFEFKKAYLGKRLCMQIFPLLDKSIEKYKDELDLEKNLILPNKSTPLVNKYDVNTMFRPHYDHVYDVFDGTKKGIPVLTIVALLNDEFEGGDFMFWKKHKVDWEIGDIIIFPSIFLYQHSVTTITKGVRYSMVTWLY